MPVSIPFLPSETNYTLTCPVDDDFTLKIDVRWNSTDAGWYIDIYESDDTVIALNVKLVLGVELGRRSHHKFFDSHKLMMADASDTSVDANFDELNGRVKLVVLSSSEL